MLGLCAYVECVNRANAVNNVARLKANAESLRVDHETSFKAGHHNTPPRPAGTQQTAVVMRSLEESRLRWQRTMNRAASLADLKLAVRSHGNDSPCVSGLRSVCWKAFFLFRSTDTSTWSGVLADSRSAYISLREHFLRYFDRPEEIGSTIDPLNDDKNSPWNILRQDEELRSEIQQDVERCMPEEPYFRQAKTQRMLLDMLFIFCKLNQDVGYRQGMHELLAPILWVVENDAVSIVEVQTKHLEGDEQIIEILGAGFLEHDAFTIFSLLMQSAKSFYELGEPDRRSSTIAGQSNNESGTSPIVDRSKRIHEMYLATVDPELADHLTAIEVLPQIFLIRWIRILFGREFSFDGLLSLWDTLFAEDPGLDLVDMICVAMLLRIRWQLLEADYSAALTLLLKYPVPHPPYGPQTFVEDAVYLRDNFNPAGAKKIIISYSGRSPQYYASTSRPATPSGTVLSLDQKISWRQSPLPSPARFLQQQSGVEALLQGAARGVFERGERLGINKAVRNAVGEVKKNMQNLQTPSPPSSRRNPDFTRRSLDESQATFSIGKTVGSMQQRNKQLSQMLEDALNDLRSLSVDGADATLKHADTIDLAIAKLQFVQVYLEDSSMPLPAESSQNTNMAKPLRTSITDSKLLQLTRDPLLDVGDKDSPVSKMPNADITSQAESMAAIEAPKPNTPRPPSIERSESSEKAPAIPVRPPAPTPTKSSLAQSLLALMLEPDESTVSNNKSSTTKAPSPFLASGRRPLRGGSREKAFLFGDEPEEGDQSPRDPPPHGGANQDYNMGSIKGSKSQ